ADQPLAERAAQLGAGDQAADVELDEDAVLGRAEHALGEALDDGGLADARFAHQDGVVGAALPEDVEELVDFAVAAEGRIEAADVGELGEVARMSGEPGK